MLSRAILLRIFYGSVPPSRYVSNAVPLQSSGYGKTVFPIRYSALVIMIHDATATAMKSFLTHVTFVTNEFCLP